MSAYLDRIRKFRGHENSAPAGYAIAGEATDIRAPKQDHTTEAKWTSTVSSKLLLEAGLAINNESYTLEPLPGSVGVIPRRDTILQTAYAAYDGGFYYREPIRRTFVGVGVVRDGLARDQGWAFSTARATSGVSGAKRPI